MRRAAKKLGVEVQYEEDNAAYHLSLKVRKVKPSITIERAVNQTFAALAILPKEPWKKFDTLVEWYRRKLKVKRSGPYFFLPTIHKIPA